MVVPECSESIKVNIEQFICQGLSREHTEIIVNVDGVCFREPCRIFFVCNMFQVSSVACDAM